MKRAGGAKLVLAHDICIHTERAKRGTHLYCVLIMRVICTHLDVGGGRTLLHDVLCVHPQENVWPDRSRSGPTARISISPPLCLTFVFTRQRRAVILVRSADGAAKGEGGVDTTWGKGAGSVVVFV